MHMSSIVEALGKGEGVVLVDELAPRRREEDVCMIIIMVLWGAKFKSQLTCVKILGRALSNLQTQVRL